MTRRPVRLYVPRPMYTSARRRRRPDEHVRLYEAVIVLVVVAAFVGLLVWIIATAGGGVLNQG